MRKVLCRILCSVCCFAILAFTIVSHTYKGNHRIQEIQYDSSEEVISYLRDNGYPETVIALMDSDWRVQSFLEKATFVETVRIINDDDSGGSSNRALFDNNSYEESLIVESYPSSTESEKLRFNYLWEHNSAFSWNLEY